MMSNGDYGIAIDNPDVITGYDQIKIHDNVISTNSSMNCSGSGPDSIQGVGGSSIYNNVIKHELGNIITGFYLSNGTHKPTIGETLTIPSAGASGKVTFIQDPPQTGSWVDGSAHAAIVVDTGTFFETWGAGGEVFVGGLKIGTADANSQWTQHADMIQGWAHYNKVYNNIFLNISDSAYDMSGDSFDNTYVFNNVFYQDSDTPICEPPGPTGLRYSGHIGPSGFNKFYVFNNTFVDMVGAGTVNLVSGTTGTVTSTEVKNNIFINSANPSHGGYSRVISMGVVGVNPNAVAIDRNLANSGPSGDNYILWNWVPILRRLDG